MINLSPPEQSEIIQKEYRLRLGLVYILLISITLLIGLVLLLPSYFIVDAQENVVVSELALMQSSSENTEREKIMSQLSLASKRLEALTSEQRVEALYTTIKSIAEHKSKDINISNITYVRGKDGLPSTLDLGGFAHTRDALINFIKVLDADRLFDEVNLPVSSFAMEVDITFNLQLKGPF